MYIVRNSYNWVDSSLLTEYTVGQREVAYWEIMLDMIHVVLRTFNSVMTKKESV